MPEVVLCEWQGILATPIMWVAATLLDRKGKEGAGKENGDGTMKTCQKQGTTQKKNRKCVFEKSISKHRR
jgi:hypothetical protein